MERETLATDVRQRRNWLVDAALFAGLLACFVLDVTGVSVHQGIGAALGLLAGYHLLVHRAWIKAVSRRFFRPQSRTARVRYAVDAAVLVALLAVLTTGVVISTWLALPPVPGRRRRRPL